MDIQSLGITVEELKQLAVQKIVDDFMGADGGDVYEEVLRQAGNSMKKRIDAAVKKFGEQEIDPIIEKMIEDEVLQRTSEWGEPKGKPLTFRQMLVKKAQEYMTEKVDYQGHDRNHYSNRGSSFRGEQGRLSFMIDKYLSHHIEHAMKDAFKDINSELSKDMLETARNSMAKAMERIKVQIKT